MGRPRRGLTGLLSSVALGAILVIVTILLVTTGRDLRELKQTVDLLRYESTSQYDGVGFNALLDHLQYWGRTMERADPATVQWFDTEARVNSIVASMAMLDGGFDQIQAALAVDSVAIAGGRTDDETRKWLLRAAYGSDHDRGKELFARYLAADEYKPTNRLRLFAATELFSVDRTRAGEILAQILSGTPDSIDGDQSRRALDPNLIDLFAESGHKDVDLILQRILGRAVHYELIPVQKCIEALGRRGCVDAVEQIMELYKSQGPTLDPSPTFRVKCLDAVVDILRDRDRERLGEFIAQVDLTEASLTVRARLEEHKRALSIR
jgi:hypothetical protein